MPRMVPCRGCGEPRWPSRHEGAPTQPLCRECRSKLPLTHGTASTYKRHGCRCDECRAAWNAQCRANQRARRVRMTRSCVECSTEFNPRSNQITCSPACRKAYLGRLGHNATRAAYFRVAYEQIDRLEVFESCGWVCGICELPVDPAAKYPDAGAPTLDHITPMSRGGGHVRANVQLAHFYCNTVKGNREEVAAC